MLMSPFCSNESRNVGKFLRVALLNQSIHEFKGFFLIDWPLQKLFQFIIPTEVWDQLFPQTLDDPLLIKLLYLQQSDVISLNIYYKWNWTSYFKFKNHWYLLLCPCPLSIFSTRLLVIVFLLICRCSLSNKENTLGLWHIYIRYFSRFSCVIWFCI